MGAERSLLLLMLKNRDYVERASEQVGPEDFEDAAYRTIFRTLLEEPELEVAPSDLDPVATARLEELLSDPEDVVHGGRIFEESLRRIRLGALERRSVELDRVLRETEDSERRKALLREKMQIAEERREVGPDWSHAARKLKSEP